MGDARSGHGTHVCGSALGALAGAAPSAFAPLFSGAAPRAKLSFDDISGDGENLTAPDDLNAQLFPHAYAAGARVYSISWGTDYTGYDTEAMEVEQLMHDLCAGGAGGLM